MMYRTNQEWFDLIAKDYPNEDWDAVPDVETLPDIYKVCGKFKSKFNCSDSFVVITEFKTLEEAKAQVERCKTTWGVEFDSIEIKSQKPKEALWKSWAKELREKLMEETAPDVVLSPEGAELWEKIENDPNSPVGRPVNHVRRRLPEKSDKIDK